MTQVVSQAVADGIDQLKKANRCNLIDLPTVVRVCEKLDLVELAEYVRKSPERYLHCLRHGCAVEEEVTAAGSTSVITVEEDVEITEAADLGKEDDDGAGYHVLDGGDDSDDE